MLENQENIESDYDKQLKKFLLPILRKRSLYWPARNEALKLARVGPNQYRCAACEKIFPRNEIQTDHKIPVVNPKTSWTNWDDFIKSLLCHVKNWQVLHKQCHLTKTTIENNIRKINHKKRKKS